jgi:hypothetical protein
MSEEQQDLRDETYQNGQAERHRQREERGQLGLPDEQTLGDFFGRDGGENGIDGESDMKDSGQGPTPKAGKAPRAGQNGDPGLARRQQALRQRLENLQKRLDDAGAGGNGLDGAKNAMRETENTLDKDPNGKCNTFKGRVEPVTRSTRRAVAWGLYGTP